MSVKQAIEIVELHNKWRMDNDNKFKMETYRWHTIEPHNNNEETMNDYLENHLSDEFEIIFEDGTYAEIKNKNTGAIWGVNASGDGDFTHHKVEFEFVH